MGDGPEDDAPHASVVDPAIGVPWAFSRLVASPRTPPAGRPPACAALPQASPLSAPLCEGEPAPPPTSFRASSIVFPSNIAFPAQAGTLARGREEGASTALENLSHPV